MSAQTTPWRSEYIPHPDGSVTAYVLLDHLEYSKSYPQRDRAADEGVTLGLLRAEQGNLVKAGIRVDSPFFDMTIPNKLHAYGFLPSK